jgi:hypothetical protein
MVPEGLASRSSGKDGTHLQHETSPPQRASAADWPAAAVSGGPEKPAAADLAAC